MTQEDAPTRRPAIAIGERLRGPRMAWLLIGIGAAARIYLYGRNRSLWLDEASFAESLVSRSWNELMLPLFNGQAAPFGFAAAEIAVVQAVGSSEYALRLIPLLCGVFTLPLFYLLAKRLLGRQSANFALAVIALSSGLIYYSSELKPYAGDAFLATALLLAAAYYFDRPGSNARLGLLAGLGVVALWFSYPAVFILGGIAVAMVFAWAAEFDWRRVSRDVVGLWLSWGVSFLAHYRLWISGQVSDEAMQSFWTGMYLPLPAYSVAALKWLYALPFNMLSSPTGFVRPGVALAVLIIGLVVFLHKRRAVYVAVIAPLVLVLIANALRVYPLGGRLFVFTMPTLALLLGAGADRLVAAGGKASRWPAQVIIAIALLSLLAGAADQLNSPLKEEMRPVVGYLGAHHEPGDQIYVYYISRFAFDYYVSQQSLGDLDYIAGSNHRDHPEDFAEEFRRLWPDGGRVWVVASHVWGSAEGTAERDAFLKWFEENGQKLDSFEAKRAAIYLYDLR